jgi:hypothetical protein
MAARIQGAAAFVERGLGGAPPARVCELLRRATEAIFPAGYPLFAALASTPWPGNTAAALWFGADLLREQRNDAHIASWRSAGLDPVESHILSALWSGQPFHLRAAFMGWRRSHITSARKRLEARALIEGDPPVFTEAGRDVRAAIEEATDRQQRPALDALDTDIDHLLDLLEPIYRAILPIAVDRGSRTGSVASSAGSTGARLPDPELLNPL